MGYETSLWQFTETDEINYRNSSSFVNQILHLMKIDLNHHYLKIIFELALAIARVFYQP